MLAQSHGADTVMVIDLARMRPGAGEEIRTEEARDLEHLLAKRLHVTGAVAEGQEHNSLYDSVMG